MLVDDEHGLGDCRVGEHLMPVFDVLTLIVAQDAANGHNTQPWKFAVSRFIGRQPSWRGNALRSTARTQTQVRDADRRQARGGAGEARL
jgi:hypothetical protein